MANGHDTDTTTNDNAAAAGDAPVEEAAAKPAPRRRRARKTAEPAASTPPDGSPDMGSAAEPSPPPGEPASGGTEVAAEFTEPAPPRTRRRRTKAASAPEPAESGAPAESAAPATTSDAAAAGANVPAGSADATAEPPPPEVLFQPPAAPEPPRRTRRRSAAKTGPESDGSGGAAGPATEPGAGAEAAAAPPDAPAGEGTAATAQEPAPSGDGDDGEGDDSGGSSGRRRRRGRRGRGRGKSGSGSTDQDEQQDDQGEQADTQDKQGSSQDRQASSKDKQSASRGKRGKSEASEDGERAGDEEQAGEQSADESGEGGSSSSRRRRRRRRRRGGGNGNGDDSASQEDGDVATVTHVREPRAKDDRSRDDDAIKGVKGSTRMEAKRQRRREGRESGRRRPPILSEAEFLARRESVERVMVVREAKDRTQIAVLEDGVLVEHYIARKQGSSYVGNVYLGKVQNVLPSMEAAFIDVGRGRNAVLYAGEVNYDASALEGKPPRIEQALKSGQSVLVQVTKDPIGHKGARTTSQISLPGRYMVYVPDGRMTGISRKLPDKERARLKGILKKITPEDSGVIIRTAAEGASEDELTRDLARLQAQWEDIQKKAKSATAPALVYAEPDLTIRVIRDVFNEDFSQLVVQGEDEWDMVDAYVGHVAPDLAERVSRWTGGGDVFAHYRVDEQLAKALDRKVWLPSGGSLVIDRTEAMVVIDVNTGKFTGSGGNLEETVTKNNLEAAEEIVRQLRLRDMGGIIVIDFIDMVLESNRDLVLRRLLECLGRDRTKHQVAEVTSLGLVQMTRKRVGTGLLEAFSETCPECNGRGVKITVNPFEPPEGATPPVAASADVEPAPAAEEAAGQAAEGATQEVADEAAEEALSDADADGRAASDLAPSAVGDEDVEVEPARPRRSRRSRVSAAES